MSILNILSNTATTLLIVNLILYAAGFFKNGKAYRVFTMYLLCISIIQLVIIILASANVNNHFVSTYFLFAQFILLSVFYYLLLTDANKVKAGFMGYASLFVTGCLIMQYILNPSLYYTFNSVGFLVTSLILILYNVLYLYEMLGKKLPFYYVTIGMLFYLTSSSFIFASATTLVTLKDKFHLYIWTLNAILFVINQILILWEWKKQYWPIMKRHR